MSTHNFTYTYNKNNQLLQETEYVAGNSENFSGFFEIVSNYSYDSNGNTKKKDISGQVDENVIEYMYNDWNQLVQYKDANGETTDYTYNGNGVRTAKSNGGITTKYYWDRDNISNEAVDNAFTATNYIGLQGVFARTSQNSTNYMFKNGHGDVVSLVNSGNIVQTYDYDAYGNGKNYNSEDTNPYRYCGEYLDSESGLIYLRNRYYNSEIGRFINEDPIKSGSNWYVYAVNNPIRYIDPSGLTYIIGWSYGTKDVREYEQYRLDNGYSVTVDGDTSDWDDATWSDFTQRSSFARAAYTKKQELIDMGVSESDVDVQRIDNKEDLEATWNMWAGYGLIEGLDFYSHGYSEGAEVYGGSGDFWKSAQKLNFGESLRQVNGKGVILQPYAVFYGCNTANGRFAQNFSNTQAITVYAQTDYASFSHTRTNRTRITTHETSKDVYLLSFESWGGLRNNDGLGKKFRPNN